MTETGEGSPPGVAALAAVPIVCCVGLPLLVGVGLGIAAASWIGGVALGTIVLAAALALVARRSSRPDTTSLNSSRRKGQHEH